MTETKKIKFREYSSLQASTLPLVKGGTPKRNPSEIGIYACGAVEEDGFMKVSLFNRETGMHFIQKMTKDEYSELSIKNGVTPVWVDNDFKFGETLLK